MCGFAFPSPTVSRTSTRRRQDRAVVELSSLLPGSQIYYTLDGSEPSDESPRYRLPFEVPLQRDRKSMLNVVVVTPTGRRSAVVQRDFPAAATIERRVPRLTTARTGVRSCSTANSRPCRTSTRHPGGDGNSSSFDLQQFGRATDYGVRFDGYLKVESDGYYRFAVESDDGAVLEIDDEVVVDNDGDHPSRRIRGAIPLRQGFHKMRLRYFQAAGGASLDVSWGIPGAELQPLEGPALYH